MNYEREVMTVTLTGKGEILEKSLFQCHIVHQNFHESLPSRGKHKHTNIVLNIYYLPGC